MGIGFACLEDLFETEGQVLAANLSEFRLPAPPDIPPLRTVLVEGGLGVGPANVKAVGELTNVPTAAAIANAVANATGARVRQLPVTAERIFRLIRDQESREESPCSFGSELMVSTSRLTSRRQRSCWT
jgi:CO/xanthine dehydrogenase Mo-binding subunit